MDNWESRSRIVGQLNTNELAHNTRLGISEGNYEPPSKGLYSLDNYLWDGCFIAEARAKTGYFRKAIRQFFAIVNGQRPDGFIPSVQFPKGPIRLYPEHYLFNEPFVGSDYLGQPILAEAAVDIYNAVEQIPPAIDSQLIDRDMFLEVAYPYLQNFYRFLVENRQNSPNDPLLGNPHPHETGRDSDPTFDFAKRFRIGRRGEHTPKLINRLNTVTDYFGALAISAKARLNNWELEKTKKTFWVNDVMFNCLYANNLDHMATIAGILGHEQDEHQYYELAREAEQAILTRMWDPDARRGKGAFYALDKDGRYIEVISISNLMPLRLSNLSPRQLESLLDLMDGSFNEPYPLPTVATDEPSYDPNYGEMNRHWRGPTWGVTNHLILEGLATQLARDDLPQELIDRCLYWFRRIELSNEAITNDGFAEHNSPKTAEGQRTRKTKGHIFGVVAALKVPLPAKYNK